MFKKLFKTLLGSGHAASALAHITGCTVYSFEKISGRHEVNEKILNAFKESLKADETATDKFLKVYAFNVCFLCTIN